MNWEAVTAISSGTIALAALVFSFFSFRAQQNRAERHAKASVKPILKIRTQKYDDQKAIKLINAGIGPAIISKAEFSKGDKKTNNIVELFNLDIVWESFINVPDGTAIQANEELDLVFQTAKHLERNNHTPHQAENIMRQWEQQKSGIQILIEYEDIFLNQQDPLCLELK